MEQVLNHTEHPSPAAETPADEAGVRLVFLRAFSDGELGSPFQTHCALPDRSGKLPTSRKVLFPVLLRVP